MRLLVLLLFVVTPVYAEIALDSKYLESILTENPDDIETRLLLASYYLKIGNLSKSEKLIDIALKQENDNRMALKLQNRWLSAKKSEQLLQELNILDLTDEAVVDTVVEKLFSKKEFDLLDQLFNILEEKNIGLSQQSQIVCAAVLVEQKKYKQAMNMIEMIEDQSDERVQKLLAETCSVLENFECATSPLEALFNSTGDLEIGLQLAEILIQQGRVLDADSVSVEINKHYINEPKAINLTKKVAGLFKGRVAVAEKEYREKPSTATIKSFTQSLFQSGNKEKAYNLLYKFIKEYPKNDEVKLFFAKQFASNQQVDSAIKMLRSFEQQTPESQFLLAKYLSWKGGSTEEAQTILNKLVSQVEVNNDFAYTDDFVRDVSLLLGNTYLWQGDKLNAQKILAPLAKEYPSNMAVQEAYMLAKNKYNPLIDQYEQQLKGDSNNAQVILRLANLYEAAKFNSKALQYYERYRRIKRTDIKVEKAMGLLYLTQKKFDLGFKFLKRYAYRLHTEKSLMNLANNYHWNGFNENSLEVIKKLQAYYPNSTKAVKLKEKVLKAPLAGRDQNLIVANKKYKERNFREAAHLYHKYLNQYSNDYYIRHRYAYALGQIGSYSKAVKEFSRVVRAKPNDLNIQYHYAYNLEQSEKYQQAKKIYTHIINKTKAATKLSGNKKNSKAKLNELARKRLDVLEKNKDVVINGIYLGGGVKKLLSPESKVLSDTFVTPVQLSQNKAHSSFVAEDILYYSSRDTKRIELDYHHTSDRVGVDFNSPRIKAQYNSWPYEINFSGGGFTFEDEFCNDDTVESGKAGGSVELSGMYEKSTSLQYGGGLRVDQLDGKTIFSPFINSRLIFDQSNIDIQLYKRPLFYEKLACKALTKHIDRYGVQVSGNMSFSKKQSLWYSVDAGYIDDDNIEVIPQFNLIVYRDKFKNRYIPVDYEFAIEGYYMWNKKETNDYYSPEFFDSTSFSFRPVFKVSKDFDLISSAAIGYSVDVNNIIYRYGAWAQYRINKGLKAKAGCERSNVGSASAGGENYHSNNCLATLEYEWK
ncbi:MAG: hypothetical protein KAH20_00170 [Methylococcales bacterium]|nr:hypothetical protein [Methylococcales bacterium]